MHFLHQKM